MTNLVLGYGNGVLEKNPNNSILKTQNSELALALAAATGLAVLEHEPLRKHTSLRIGGPADLFLTVKSTAQLIAAVHTARELELPQRTLESYLRHNIDFSLDEENRRGLELYFAYAANLGLIPQAKPIEWAAAKAETVKS